MRAFVLRAVLDDAFPDFGGRAGEKYRPVGGDVEQFAQLLGGMLVNAAELLAPVRKGADLLGHSRLQVRLESRIQLGGAGGKENVHG